MKKLLLTTAVAGLAFVAPAHAEVNLEVGGYFMGYGAYVDQDENNNEQVNDVDFVKETELHFSGETTLDNGLTVGAHIELDVDGGETNSAASVEESYAYFSGSWGRVNMGEEDGAAYLLQVAAPSADSNVDGIRPLVDGVNEDVLLGSNAVGGNLTFLDYDQDQTGYTTKLTYLSPVVNGFQFGASFTPDADNDAGSAAIGTDNAQDTFGNAYDLGLRYEGEYEGVGVTVGAGYTNVELEANTAVAAGEAKDDREAWNVGLDLDFGPFGAGVSYQEDDHGEVAKTVTTNTVDDEEILVFGVDYTTGPFKLGASYFDSENVDGNDDVDAKRYTGGVVYTYGPGMTLRGSVSYVEYEGDNVAGTNPNLDDADATQFLIGTKVKF